MYIPLRDISSSVIRNREDYLVLNIVLPKRKKHPQKSRNIIVSGQKIGSFFLIDLSTVKTFCYINIYYVIIFGFIKSGESNCSCNDFIHRKIKRNVIDHSSISVTLVILNSILPNELKWIIESTRPFT